MSFDVNITVTLTIKTCSCGTLYAVPDWVVAYRCPMCSQRKYEAQRVENENREEEIKRLGRANAALRGVIKKRGY